MHGLLELNETAPANSGARLDVTSAEAKSVKPSTVASGKDDNNKGDTPTVPTQPTKPDTPSTDDTNNGNADSSTGDAATAPSTESGEGATTGDTARPVVYAVLAMMAAGLVLSVVVYDNKKKRI